MMRFSNYHPVTVIRNEKGMALVLSLLLGLVGMVMILSVLYMVGTGTWMSGSKRRYQTSLAVNYGGMDFFNKEIIPRGLAPISLSAMGTYNNLLTTGGAGFTTDAAFTTKLTTTGTFAATPPDARFTLTLPGPDMQVDTTIVNSSRGNSGLTTNLLQTGGVVNNNTGTITPQHLPYLFQTDNRAHYDATSANESARLSALYAY